MVLSRNSKVKREIEKRLGLSFREIVIKHLSNGMGRYQASRIIDELCKNSKTEEQEDIRFSTSSLWYIIKNAIETGEICEILGDPSSKPIFDFNAKNIKYKKNEKEKEDLEIVTNYKCCVCKSVWQENKRIKSIDSFHLRTKECPNCSKSGRDNSIGNIVIDFEFKGVRIKKAIALVDYKMMECFVDNDFNVIENPVESEMSV